MTSSDKIALSIRQLISTDLAMPSWADAFFDYLEFIPFENIEIDFSDVASISRSFAHQYWIRKNQMTHKTVYERNMSENVRQMFELVSAPRGKVSFREISEPRALPV